MPVHDHPAPARREQLDRALEPLVEAVRERADRLGLGLQHAPGDLQDVVERDSCDRS